MSAKHDIMSSYFPLNAKSLTLCKRMLTFRQKSTGSGGAAVLKKRFVLE
jgi:hypothetical protein